MSKKPRPKKKYRPRLLSVPPYIAAMDASIGKSQEQGRLDDQTFLLRMANRTAEQSDLVFRCQLMRAAWLLAERMEEAKTIRECLFNGVEALGAYLPEGHKEFTEEYFEMLTQATEVARSVFENASRIERAQAMAAVMDDRFNLAMLQSEQRQMAQAG